MTRRTPSRSLVVFALTAAALVPVAARARPSEALRVRADGRSACLGEAEVVKALEGRFGRGGVVRGEPRPDAPSLVVRAQGPDRVSLVFRYDASQVSVERALDLAATRCGAAVQTVVLLVDAWLRKTTWVPPAPLAAQRAGADPSREGVDAPADPTSARGESPVAAEALFAMGDDRREPPAPAPGDPPPAPDVGSDVPPGDSSAPPVKEAVVAAPAVSVDLAPDERRSRWSGEVAALGGVALTTARFGGVQGRLRLGAIHRETWTLGLELGLSSAIDAQASGGTVEASSIWASALGRRVVATLGRGALEAALGVGAVRVAAESVGYPLTGAASVYDLRLEALVEWHQPLAEWLSSVVAFGWATRLKEERFLVEGVGPVLVVPRSQWELAAGAAWKFP